MAATIGPPTQAGFIAWVRSAMGISTSVLPDDSVWFLYAYMVAVDIVDLLWSGISPDIYTLMVYNLGGSNLLNFAQDEPGAPPVTGSGSPGLPFFAFTRKEMNILGPVSGVVSSAGDQGTSLSLEVAQALKTLTLADLQYLKDPYGRTYLQFAQRQGSLWNIV